MIPDRLSTLGHPQRLAVFRLLMRRYPDKVPAGELANALGLKASTLSAYLSALMQVGLVLQEREGTLRRYSVSIDSVGETFDYVLNECCRGRPEICAPFAGSPGTKQPGRIFNVLFLCTGNSARSIFAEALLRMEGQGRFRAFSAGTAPKSELNPHALALLRDKGHETSLLKAKHISKFQGKDAPHMDFVFTVCDQAANEECPAWAGQPVSAHWGMPDPVQTVGTKAQQVLAFQQTYGALRNRILAFTALPFAALDKVLLQQAVDEIGQNLVGEFAQ